MQEDDEDGLLAWPEEDGMMGDEMFHPNPHPPRWVGIPRMNGTHNLARAGAAAQQNAVEVSTNLHLHHTSGIVLLHMHEIFVRKRASPLGRGGDKENGARRRNTDASFDC